jgi:hypothetical protein
VATRRAPCGRAGFFEIGFFRPERFGYFFSLIDVTYHNSETIDSLAPFVLFTGDEMDLERDRCGAVGVLGSGSGLRCRVGGLMLSGLALWGGREP